MEKHVTVEISTNMQHTKRIDLFLIQFSIPLNGFITHNIYSKCLLILAGETIFFLLKNFPCESKCQGKSTIRRATLFIFTLANVIGRYIFFVALKSFNPRRKIEKEYEEKY